jgi:hypothetical protein
MRVLDCSASLLCDADCAISSRNPFAQYPKPECRLAGVKGIAKDE